MDGDQLIVPVPITCRQLADLFGVPVAELLSALRARGYPCHEGRWLLDIGIGLAAEHFGLRARVELQWETELARDEDWPQVESMAQHLTQDDAAAPSSDPLIRGAIARLAEFMKRPADDAEMSALRRRIATLEEQRSSDAAVNEAWSMLLEAALGPELQARFREKLWVEFATVETVIPAVEILDVDEPRLDYGAQPELAELIRRILDNPDSEVS